VEIVKLSLFREKIEKVSAFINMARLYLSIKITEEPKITKIAWVLSYVQGGIAKTWKNNLLDKLLKEESEVKTVEELFTKMRNEFGKTVEEEQKIEQLRMIKQGERTCNEYIQEFKKVAQRIDYKKWPLIEEFKRRLNGVIRRKLVEAENSLSLYNREVTRLDKNQR